MISGFSVLTIMGTKVHKKKLLPTSTMLASRSENVWVVIWYGIDLEEPGDVEWDDQEERTEISRMKTLLTQDLQYKKDA